MPSRNKKSRKLPFESPRSEVSRGRSKESSKFYNNRSWRKYSKNFRSENRVCVRCQRLILDISHSVTDHLIRMELGGSGWDKRNHGVMHRDCHGSKSAAESRGLQLPKQLNEDGEYIPLLNDEFYKLLRDE